MPIPRPLNKKETKSCNMCSHFIDNGSALRTECNKLKAVRIVHVNQPHNSKRTIYNLYIEIDNWLNNVIKNTCSCFQAFERRNGTKDRREE